MFGIAFLSLFGMPFMTLMPSSRARFSPGGHRRSAF
jgi:hypothetical protein